MSEKPGKRLIIHSNAHRDRSPTAPTVPKRLVSKMEYVGIVVNAGILPLILLGEGVGCVFLFKFIFSDFRGRPASWNASGMIFQCTILLLVVCAFCLAARKARAQVESAISSVAPITRHNTGHLPAVETLVRASAAPPSPQQAELLRAAPQGSETPAEELLRATTNRQDD